MTGKNPGKHGVFHFIKTERDSYAMDYANGGSRRLTSAFRSDSLTEHPVRADTASLTSGTGLPSGYTDEESPKVEERIQALGYLE